MNWAIYHRLLNVVVISISVMIATSCGNSSRSQQNDSTDSYENTYRERALSGEETYNGDYSFDDDDAQKTDGTYSADVDYYNPDTGYSASYTLDVEVIDGCVTTIYFPNGGYLDDTHIDATELDENGDCAVYDDEGREYSIHIDL